jgi:hypothetical protein
MTRRCTRITLALVMPLLLWSCVLVPGKFVSTMMINADRSFAFTYKGEVIALDPSSAVKGLPDKPRETAPSTKPSAFAEQDNDKDSPASDDPEAEREAKYREIAAALTKEVGYRSVAYEGKGKFRIDYAIAGTLTHNFAYPFNSDAEAIIPFVAIELRQGGTVRLKAPGFAKGSGGSGMGSMGTSMDAGRTLDGTFTLTTDAEIVSQNNEAGAQTANGRKSITWRVTPLSTDAPTAVLRMKG